MTSQSPEMGMPGDRADLIGEIERLREVIRAGAVCMSPTERARWIDRARAEMGILEACIEVSVADSLYEALAELVDVFAYEGEDSLSRFERLAEMFRRDTGYLAPGKDQPMAGPEQPDGEELRRIYDDWFAAKVVRARAALSKARGGRPLPDHASGPSEIVDLGNGEMGTR